MSTLLTDDNLPNATYSGLMLVEELLRLKRIAENKRLAREAVAKHRGRPDSVPHERPWASQEDRLAETTMREITPALLDSRERADSDSTNGRMHKLINGDAA